MTEKTTETSNVAGEKAGEQQFVIQRIYLKDLSFEIIDAPKVFKEPWKPKLVLEVNISKNAIDADVYEVVLTVTAKVHNHEDEKPTYVVEAKEAGIFTIKGLTEVQRDLVLSGMCPNILFPYAREVVTDVAVRGSFPQLV